MRRSILVLILVAGLLLSACGGTDVQAAIATGIYQTQQISELQTAAAAAAQPTHTSAATAQAESETPTETATETATATKPAPPVPTHTSAPNYSLAGNWNVMWNGLVYTLNVSVSGSGFSAVLIHPELTYNFSGSVSGGGQNASGTWSHTNGGTGTFQIQIKPSNLNQFVGNKTDDGSGQPAGQFCGWRGGASMPSPCMGP